MNTRQDKLRKLFDEAEPEVKQVVLRVFQIERDMLHLGRPHGIYDELIQAIKQIVT